MPIDRSNPAILNLLSLVGSRADVSQDEIRRYVASNFRSLDRNSDSFISSEEMGGTVLETMTTVDLASVTGLTDDEKARLQRAQALLRTIVRERLTPPPPTTTPPPVTPTPPPVTPTPPPVTPTPPPVTPPTPPPPTISTSSGSPTIAPRPTTGRVTIGRIPGLGSQVMTNVSAPGYGLFGGPGSGRMPINGSRVVQRLWINTDGTIQVANDTVTGTYRITVDGQNYYIRVE